MASYVPCKKNDANGYIFYVSLVSQANTKIFQANPTYAAGDIQVAVDDAAPGNVDAVAIDADFTKRVKITLSQAQTNGDNLTVICSDAAGAEWCDLTINIQTSAQTLDEIDVNVDDIETDTNEIQGKLPANKFMGSSDGADDDGTLNAITAAGPTKVELDTAQAAIIAEVDANETKIDAIKAETVLIVEDTGTTLPGTLATIAGYVDAEVAAILADTNELQIDWADGGRLDVILDAAGGAGDPWITALPGAYGAGTAGKIVGDNINAPIATVDTVVDAIKAVTDLLPNAGALSDLATILADTNELQTDWVNGGRLDLLIDAIKAVTDSLPDGGALTALIALVDDLETRLSAVRAGYLDELAAANLPSDVDNLMLDVDYNQNILDNLEFWLEDGGRLDLLIDAIKAVTDNLPDAGGLNDLGALEVRLNAVRAAALDELTPANIPADIDAIKLKTDALPSGVAKNVAFNNLMFTMVLATDGKTPATGKTVVAQISKDGGAFVNCANAVAEVSNGWYKISLIQAEMNADIVALKFTETDCLQRNMEIATT